MTASSADVLDAVVERHLVVLGKTGWGKTYAAKGIVERLLQRRRRVCIVDPTGVWWGLKATADGGPSQLPVAVLGGDHGDLPLEESMGEATAAAVVRQPIALVLDLSLMTHSARNRFLTDFFAALFRLNRDVLHLVLDEADEAAPQNPLPEVAELQRALERASARIAALEAEVEVLRLTESQLKERLAQVARIAQVDGALPVSNGAAAPQGQVPDSRTGPGEEAPRSEARLHPAARRLLTALAQHAPARFTWGQIATLAGLKPSGGHFNAGRKELRDGGLVEERDGCVAITKLGLAEAGEQAPAPSSPAERLEVWCARLPSPAPTDAVLSRGARPSVRASTGFTRTDRLQQDAEPRRRSPWSSACGTAAR
jgi:Helicase HerA, central domain